MSFIPLHQSALERHVDLLTWIRSWCGNNFIHPLSTEDWFDRGHDVIGGRNNTDGMWIPKFGARRMLHLWAPPPALALLAIEELRKARHKRQLATHIFVCPRLLTVRWRRLLNKAGDVVLEIPASWEFWPATMFEPLILCIVLPFSTRSPWQMQRAPEVVALERQLQVMWKNEGGDARPILRQLLKKYPKERIGV